MRELLAGFWTVPRAAGLLGRTPRLRRLAAWPLVLSIVLLVVLAFLSIHYAPALVEHFWPAQPGASGWRASLSAGAHGLAKLLAVGVGLVLGGALYFAGAAVLVEPFIDPLSEATEQALGVESPAPPLTLGGVALDLLRVLGEVALDLTILGVVQAGLLLLHFVPVVGPPLQLVLGWLANAWFSALEMSSGPLARRGVRGRQRWQVLRSHGGRALGFGTGVLLLLLIPLLQVVTIPIAVVGGAVLTAELGLAAGRSDEGEKLTAES